MLGEIAALTAAVCWALSSIYFAEIGFRIGALNLNLIKGLLACLMMLLVLVIGSWAGFEELNLVSLTSMPVHGRLLLVLSGIIGIGLGDTAYFACLRRIGPQKGLMLESTAPILAAVLAFILFGENHPLLAWFGIFVTTIGVILVVRLSEVQGVYILSVAGVMYGLVAAGGQAAGIVLSRMALAGGQVDPLASSLVRLVSGLAILLLWRLVVALVSMQRNEKSHLSLVDSVVLLFNRGLMKKTVAAVIIGTFVALWLQQISVRYTGAGIAQTLLATCPLFGSLIGYFQGQRQSLSVWIGLALGVCGVSMLFLF